MFAGQHADRVSESGTVPAISDEDHKSLEHVRRLLYNGVRGRRRNDSDAKTDEKDEPVTDEVPETSTKGDDETDANFEPVQVVIGTRPSSDAIAGVVKALLEHEDKMICSDQILIYGKHPDDRALLHENRRRREEHWRLIYELASRALLSHGQ